MLSNATGPPGLTPGGLFHATRPRAVDLRRGAVLMLDDRAGSSLPARSTGRITARSTREASSHDDRCWLRPFTRPGHRCAAGPASPRPPAAAGALEPEPDWKPLGRSLWFDPRQKQLVIKARVVLREGPLEHLLCLKGTKEHEAILATDALPRQIHAGLLLTGAEPGHPVRFVPKFEPPPGRRSPSSSSGRATARPTGPTPASWVKDEKAGSRSPRTGSSPAASCSRTRSPRRRSTPPTRET